jgi:hypothetical protein
MNCIEDSVGLETISMEKLSKLTCARALTCDSVRRYGTLAS